MTHDRDLVDGDDLRLRRLGRVRIPLSVVVRPLVTEVAGGALHDLLMLTGLRVVAVVPFHLRRRHPGNRRRLDVRRRLRYVGLWRLDVGWRRMYLRWRYLLMTFHGRLTEPPPLTTNAITSPITARNASITRVPMTFSTSWCGLRSGFAGMGGPSPRWWSPCCGYAAP